MAENENKSVVVGQFASEEKAHAAADQMKSWDKASKEISLGAMQVMFMKDGKVESKAAGSRKTGSGAKWGAIVGVVAGVFSGGLTLLAGAAYGAIAGGLLGSLKKAGLKVSDAELQKVQLWLDQGSALLVVMCDEGEMAPTEAQLKAIGASQAMSFVMPADAMNVLDEAAAQMSDAGDAAADAASSAGDAAADAAKSAGSSVADAASSAGNAAADAASSAGDAVADAASSAGDAVADAASSAGDAVADAASSAGDAAAGAAKAASGAA